MGEPKEITVFFSRKMSDFPYGLTHVVSVLCYLFIFFECEMIVSECKSRGVSVRESESVCV